MKFENIGRLCKKNAFFWSLLALGVLPVIFCLFFLFNSISTLSIFKEEVFSLHQLAMNSLFKRLQRMDFLSSFSEPNPNFIQQELEGISLLEREKEAYQEIFQYPLFKHDAKYAARLSFLQSNHLLFHEESRKSTIHIKETEERQLQPVEINGSDLEQILSIIEHLQISSYHPKSGSPQIIFTDFRLKNLSDNSHFQLNTKLLKREFYP